MGPSQVDKLWGGSGDDKIWMINPEQRADDTVADTNYGYGNDGNDKLYGSAGPDHLWGDDYDDDADTIATVDVTGGDDWLAGYGGADEIWGGYGND